MKKIFAVVPGIVAALVFSQAAFASTANPYTGQGSDISWPQGAGPYPSGASFGIVGIDHGRPFDPDNQFGPNLYLASQYAWAQGTRRADLYMNTGYDPSYYTNHAVPECTSLMARHGADPAHQEAWEIGCATAWFNYN